MGVTLMARKKPQAGATDDRSGRKTAPIQVEKELARMAAVIAAHRGVTMAEVISPLIRQWLVTNYDMVQKEMAVRVKEIRESAG